MTGFKVKRTSKLLSYRRRHQRITSHEQVQSKELKLLILAMMAKLKLCDDMIEQQRIEVGLKLLIARYLQLVIEPAQILEPPPRFDRSIESFSSSNCRLFFAFSKTDLSRLLHLLQIPASVVFDNRAKMSGEEVLLRGLYELVGGDTVISTKYLTLSLDEIILHSHGLLSGLSCGNLLQFLGSPHGPIFVTVTLSK